MLSILEWIAIGVIPFFMLLDLVVGPRRFKTSRFWRLRGLAVTVATFYISLYVSLFWAKVLEGVSLIDGSGLGIAGGAIVGILVYELVHYWYHRAAHRFDALWRWSHQMHHSAESLDAFGAQYLHPLDTFFFTTWASLVFFPLLGLLPEAGMLAAVFVGFNAMFQHANLRTPRWLGYIIQRPESHGIHHERGVHAFNYADLPLWDMVFGTFRNPRHWEAQTGFHDGASARIFSMLVGRDVSQAPTPPAPRTPTELPARVVQLAS